MLPILLNSPASYSTIEEGLYQEAQRIGVGQIRVIQPLSRRKGWMDGWMDGWVGGWMDGWMDGYMDDTWRYMDTWIHGWMSQLMDETNRTQLLPMFSLNS